MSDPRDEQLIERLTHELAPVKPVAPLRAVALVALGAGVLACAVAVEARGVRPDLWQRLLEMRAFVAVLVGLAATAGGAVVAGLASSRPGRSDVARVGLWVLGVGAIGSVVACLATWLLAADPGQAFRGTTPMWADAGCLLQSVAYSLFPALVALVLAMRGASLHPLRTAALVGAGGMALGALGVHLGCTSDAVRHVLLAHVLAPGFGALAMLPAASVLGRRLSGEAGAGS